MIQKERLFVGMTHREGPLRYLKERLMIIPWVSFEEKDFVENEFKHDKSCKFDIVLVERGG